METIVLAANKRDILGKANARLRRQGSIPAVLYGHGIPPLALAVPERDFARAYRTAGESTLVELHVDDAKPVKVLIHETQEHPVSGKTVHVDFYQVRMDERITAEVALRFVGDAPAVKELGGVLVKNFDHLKVSCLPGDLVPEIVVESASLVTFDDVIRIRDLALPKTLEVLEKEDSVVATVIPPRSEEELKALEEKPEEDVEAIAKIEKKPKEEEGEETTETAAGTPVPPSTPEKKP